MNIEKGEFREQQEPDENEIREKIAAAEGIVELAEELLELGHLRGSRRDYMAGELLDLIAYIANGDEDERKSKLLLITRNYGLRDKVADLLGGTGSAETVVDQMLLAPRIKGSLPAEDWPGSLSATEPVDFMRMTYRPLSRSDYTRFLLDKYYREEASEGG